MLVIYINIYSFENSLWCQKVISIQTGLVRQTPTKILVLLNNQFKKKNQCLTIVLSRDDRRMQTKRYVHEELC